MLVTRKSRALAAWQGLVAGAVNLAGSSYQSVDHRLVAKIDLLAPDNLCNVLITWSVISRFLVAHVVTHAWIIGL